MSAALGWGVLLAVSFHMSTFVAMAQGSGESVSGTLQVAKDRIELKHVFAVMEEDPFSNGEKEKLTVLLSDAPVPADKRKASNEWRIWVSDNITAGAVHGLIVTIDPESKVWDSGHVLTKRGFMFYTESVSGDTPRNLHFEPSGAIGDRVVGKLLMKEPMMGMSDDDGPWRVEAQFNSAVVRRPAVTAVLTGDAALKSAQYKTAMAFMEACRKKDVEAIRMSIAPDSRDAMMQMFSGDNKEEALNTFAQMAADAHEMTLTKITVRGDTADVELRNTKGDGSSLQSFHEVLSGGEWKIAR